MMMKLAVVTVAALAWSLLPAVSWAFVPSTIPSLSSRRCSISCSKAALAAASSKEEDLAMTLDVIMASMNIESDDEEAEDKKDSSVTVTLEEGAEEESPEPAIATEEEIESVSEGVAVADESPPVLSKEELASLTVAELKEKLRASGLRVSGKKAELIERLLNGA